MFKTNLKAINSFLAFKYNDFKAEMTIGISICAGIFLAQLAIVVISSQLGVNSNNNSGMMVAGSATLLITFMIGIFVSLSNSEIKNAFRFPINRPAYALGSLIYILAAPLAFIAVGSAFYLLELATYNILSLAIDNMMYVHAVPVGGYLEGMLPTYATAVFALSMIYMLSMYFHRFKLPFTILLAVFIFLSIILPDFRLAFDSAFTNGFRIKSILPFTLYMLGISFAAHLLAFIPLKTMEVK